MFLGTIAIQIHCDMIRLHITVTVKTRYIIYTLVDSTHLAMTYRRVTKFKLNHGMWKLRAPRRSSKSQKVRTWTGYQTPAQFII